MEHKSNETAMIIQKENVPERVLRVLAKSITLADYHSERIKKFAAIRGVSENRAIDILINVHRKTRKMDEFLSQQIGEEHNKYLIRVAELGDVSEINAGKHFEKSSNKSQ
jgi:hypothetical protein